MPESETTDGSDQSRADLREAAIAIVRRLVEHEHEAFFAGGCVRDRLLGLAPGDYDIATSARPEDVKKIFRNVRFVGESFGVMLVRSKGHTIEVATFRTDGVYSDSRHPDEVEFSDAEHDALRRDFTINGMFEDPLEDRIIDHVGGRADLEARVIRAIGDAESRLREDHLRMLRAVRFAARFGCSIEEHTADAIRANAEHLAGVSRERIGEEVKRMMRDKSRGVAAWELQYLGLDKRVLREDHCLAAPTRLGRLPEQTSYPASLAAWLLDRYPDETCRRRITIAKRWVESLVLSNNSRGPRRVRRGAGSGSSCPVPDR